MTDQTIRLPNASDEVNGTLARLTKRLERTRRRNGVRTLLYDGKNSIKQVGSVIPPQYYNLGIVLGWPAKAVDMLARRCNLDGFVWPDGDLDSLGLKDLLDGNRLLAQYKAGLVSSLIHGPSFLINTRGDTSKGEPESLIHVKDALNATGEWNGRRHALDNLLSITSRDKHGDPDALALYLDGVTIEAEKDRGRWKWTRQEHPWGVPAETLIYKARVGREFGSSRISRAIMSIHGRALRAVVRNEAHMDVYSIPQLILLGASDSVFKNPDGSYKAAWQVALGRVFGLKDDDEAVNPRADVKHIEAASPDSHLKNLRQLAMEFSGEASIPLTSLGISDMSNPTSADSYIASREDLIAEAEGATDDWTLPLARSLSRGLAIQAGLNGVPRQWASIAPQWRSPVYLSRAAQADAGMKQLAAIPWLADTEVGLELVGLDKQQIDRALAERRRAEGSAALTSILDRFAGNGDAGASA